MAFRSSTLAKSNTGGDLTATPAGVDVGDYLGGFWCADNSGNPPTSTPAGWTARATADLSGTDVQTIRYYDSLATGSDTFLFANGNSNPDLLICSAHSGRHQTTPRTDLQITVNESDNATPVSASCTGATAADGDDLMIYIGTSQNVSSDVWIFTEPSGGTWTKRQDDHCTTWTAASSASKDGVSAGATGALVYTITRSSGTGTTEFGAVVVAIAATPPKPSFRLPRLRPAAFSPGIAR